MLLTYITDPPDKMFPLTKLCLYFFFFTEIANPYLGLNVRSDPQKTIHTWFYKHGKKMPREFLGLMEESIGVILLSNHAFKLPSKYLCFYS